MPNRPAPQYFYAVLTSLVLAMLAHYYFSPEPLSAATTRTRYRTDSEQRIIDIYKKANLAVVNLNVTSVKQDFFFPSYQDGSGSGVIIDSTQGIIATNFHVIKGARQVQAVLSNGRSYEVQLIGEDPANELALLKIVDPPENLTALPLGDSSSLEVGQSVLAIGSPFGLNRTLTQGIISSLGRNIRSDRGTFIEDVIQTDAAINPGNSGGPLIDLDGKVIGLNTAIVSKSGDYAGIGFAIPSNYIRMAIPELVQFGRVRRGHIGIILEETRFGVVVLAVQNGSPAEDAGLKGAQKVSRSGNFIKYYVDINGADFIVGINGTKVSSKDQVNTIIAKAKDGKPLSFTLRRGVSKDKLRRVQIKPQLK